jgi:hypothetical protein
MHPIIQTWGTQQHLRYAIADTSGRFWSGSGWATQQRDALLYSSHHDASAAAHQLSRHRRTGRTLRRRASRRLVANTWERSVRVGTYRR